MAHQERHFRIGKEWFILVPLGLLAIAFIAAFALVNMALKNLPGGGGGGGGGGGHKSHGGGHGGGHH